MDLEKKTIRVWFNHWFSTCHHIICLMKENSNYNVYVIGSNENNWAVYKNACDEWYQEPSKLSSDEYVEYCLSFCKEHNIDVFVPKNKMIDISKNKSRFEQIGVKVVVEDNYETLCLIEDKCKTFENLRLIIPNNIPKYYVAQNKEEFYSCYNNLSKEGYKVCYKLIQDEGASSFRVIDNSITELKALREKPGNKIKIEDALSIIDKYDFSIPIMLMPFLSGVECSIDCLKYNEEYIVVPRYKTNKRYSEILDKDGLIEKAKAIIDYFDFNMPVNIQFKYMDNVPYLLEINARMSGGVPLSCLGGDVNIPSLLIDKLYNVTNLEGLKVSLNKKVVHLETPICIR